MSSINAGISSPLDSHNRAGGVLLKGKLNDTMPTIKDDGSHAGSPDVGNKEVVPGGTGGEPKFVADSGVHGELSDLFKGESVAADLAASQNTPVPAAAARAELIKQSLKSTPSDARAMLKAQNGGSSSMAPRSQGSDSTSSPVTGAAKGFSAGQPVAADRSGVTTTAADADPLMPLPKTVTQAHVSTHMLGDKVVTSTTYTVVSDNRPPALLAAIRAYRDAIYAYDNANSTLSSEIFSRVDDDGDMVPMNFLFMPEASQVLAQAFLGRAATPDELNKGYPYFCEKGKALYVEKNHLSGADALAGAKKYENYVNSLMYWTKADSRVSVGANK